MPLVYLAFLLFLICLLGVDWGLQVKCRICKLKLLSVQSIGLFCAAFTQHLGMCSLVFHIVLNQTECK